MSLIQAYKGLGLTRYLTVLDAAGAAIAPGANDILRVRIMRLGQDPKLTVTSEAATANGSSLTKNVPTGKNTLRLDASDLSFAAGIYIFRFDYFDNADSQEYKKISDQVFDLQDQ